MIEWKGLFANTPYSSANNKTQDDAVTGMQDTIYATSPGYGAYRAIARVYNQSGAIVAEIPLSSGGGQLSAPPPVRILDDSTTYSYSLQVVEGAIPPGDADGVVIRIIGGSAKRFPVALTQTSSGALVTDRPIKAPGIRAPEVLPAVSRVSMIGDSNSMNTAVTGGVFQYAIMASGGRKTQVVCSGVGGDTPEMIRDRFLATFTAGAQDEIWILAGSNGGALTDAMKVAFQDMTRFARQLGARPVFWLPPLRQTTSDAVNTNTVAIWLRKYCEDNRIEWVYPWDALQAISTGLGRTDCWYQDSPTPLGIHPAPAWHKAAGDAYAVRRFERANRRPIASLYTWNGNSGRGQLDDDNFKTKGTASLAAGWAVAASVTPTKTAVPTLAVTKTGTGNGTVTVVTALGSGQAERITLTFSSATAFSVAGSISGAMGTGVVGAAFTHPRCTVIAVAGGTAWVNTDTAYFDIPADWNGDDAGNWQNFAVSLNDGAPTGYALRQYSGVVGGKEYRSQFRLKLKDMVGLSVSIYLEWKTGASTTPGSTAKIFHEFLRTDVDGVVSFVGTAPEAANGVWLYLACSRVGGAGTTATGTASVGVSDMTETGL